MRHLASPFGAIETLPSPLPRPDRLAAYLDREVPKGGAASTVVGLLVAGFGILSGGQSVAPPPFAVVQDAPGLPEPEQAIAIDPRPTIGIPAASHVETVVMAASVSMLERPRAPVASPPAQARIAPDTPFHRTAAPAPPTAARIEPSTPVAFQNVAAPIVESVAIVAAPPEARYDLSTPLPATIAQVADPDASAIPRQTPNGVAFAVNTRVNGVAAGRISLLLEGSMAGDTDRVADNVSVRLDDIVDLLSARMSPELLGWLKSSTHLDSYVTLNDLRAHGIAAGFDDGDRLVLKAM